jgi:hypothetical protein
VDGKATPVNLTSLKVALGHKSTLDGRQSLDQQAGPLKRSSTLGSAPETAMLWVERVGDFRGLHQYMTAQKLNLLQLASSIVTEREHLCERTGRSSGLLA